MAPFALGSAAVRPQSAAVLEFGLAFWFEVIVRVRVRVWVWRLGLGLGG